MGPTIANLEYLRQQAKQRFDNVRGTWIECGEWALPHRTKWLKQQMPGQRNNRHIVDNTHGLALRSYVAGFLEGNTSASRPWFRLGIQDSDLNQSDEARAFFQRYTQRCQHFLSQSNFYYEAGQFYYDFGTFNTGAHYIEEDNKGLYFFTLAPGSYFLLNNHRGQADTMIREFSLTVKALVDQYGVMKNGSPDWSMFSDRVKNAYEHSDYTTMVDVVHIMCKNTDYNINLPPAGSNRQWLSVHYELGGQRGAYYQDGLEFGAGSVDPREPQKFLRLKYSKRQPFIAGRSESSNNFEYGERGPTLDALGIIKSLNKKAIAKDQAIEKILSPAMQGPASLKKSYITQQSNSYVPLDPQSYQLGGMKPVNQLNPAINILVQDVTDLRSMVEKFYYADYLLFLSRNPKTRTATETNAIVNEQQLVIGPNLQSLNWTYNIPVVEFVMDYVLDEDPQLGPIPDDVQGQFVRVEFISVFAQAMKAADLPSVERYMAMISQVGQISPSIFDKVNLDKLADLYADRLYLPVGLNRPQDQVDKQRQQQQAMAQQQQALQQTLPAVAGAAKDLRGAMGPSGGPPPGGPQPGQQGQ